MIEAPIHDDDNTHNKHNEDSREVHAGDGDNDDDDYTQARYTGGHGNLRNRAKRPRLGPKRWTLEIEEN